MNNLIIPLQKNRVYFWGLILFLVSGITSLILLGRSFTSISPHAHHPFWLNVFFINYTFTGDGIFACCIIGICLFYLKKKQTGIALLVAFILSGIMVQGIKNLLCSGGPQLFFESGQYLFFFNDVSMTTSTGFPSGHTATAFTITTVFLLLQKDKKLQLPLLVAAILVGYSRIYLAQHFLIDILSGALIGSLSGFVAVILVKDPGRINQVLRKVVMIQKRQLINPPDTIQHI